jgi:hypothetical protein
MKCANNTSLNFESRDLDEILVEGTSLYRVIAETTGRSGYLSHNQLTTSVTFRQERCQVSYVLDHFYGTINREINLEAQQTCFYEAFSQAILLSNFQLLTVNDLTVAIYIDTTRNLFYLFDSSFVRYQPPPLKFPMSKHNNNPQKKSISINDSIQLEK